MGLIAALPEEEEEDGRLFPAEFSQITKFCPFIYPESWGEARPRTDSPALVDAGDNIE